MKPFLLGVLVVGLSVAPYSSARADFVLGVSIAPDAHGRGATVTGVTEPSAAKDLGIKVGDIIDRCNNYPVGTLCLLNAAIALYSTTDPKNPNRIIVKLGIRRIDGGDWDVTATLGPDADSAGILARGKTRAFNVHPSSRAARSAASANLPPRPLLPDPITLCEQPNAAPTGKRPTRFPPLLKEGVPK
jgi:hypothetical protein